MSLVQATPPDGSAEEERCITDRETHHRTNT